MFYEMFMVIKRNFKKVYGKKNPGMKTSPNHFLFCVIIYRNSICCSGLELTQTIFCLTLWGTREITKVNPSIDVFLLKYYYFSTLKMGIC